VENHDEKFRAEKLPGLLEAEIKKREPPPKDPILAAMKAEIDAMKADKEKVEAETKRAKQLSRAIPKLTEMGLDAELAERLIGNTDDETDSLLDTFGKSFVKARDGYTEKILKDRFGNQVMPPRGDQIKPGDLGAQYAQAIAEGNADLALVLQGKMQAEVLRR
jgi:ribosomal protein L17